MLTILYLVQLKKILEIHVTLYFYFNNLGFQIKLKTIKTTNSSISTPILSMYQTHDLLLILINSAITKDIDQAVPHTESKPAAPSREVVL